MSRRLDDLHPMFRPFAVELVARCVERQIGIIIVDTKRSQSEHEDNLARGVSWTRRSKHLDGAAIDIAPWAQWNLYGPDKILWDAKDPVWQRLGDIGKSLGLTWGGEWRVRDMGHFEADEALYNLIRQDIDRREPGGNINDNRRKFA